ncbi:MAG: hypothetical protein K5637_04975 [Lachnospiraceae bacterium]|nr:hypothetical protein [Lachnospiraceae bacterium]
MDIKSLGNRFHIDIDFEETTAVPESHAGKDGFELVQHNVKEEDGIAVIDENVAVPEVYKVSKKKEEEE